MSAVPPADSSTRDEIRRLNTLIAGLQEAIDNLAHTQDVQFKRIAQLQADIDVIRGTLTKRRATDGDKPPDKRSPYAGPERRLTARKK